jgi:hypothetical protein
VPDKFDLAPEGKGFMSNKAILENISRYRAVASLYRQTAAFRPIQRHSLLAEAARWEHLALSELEAYFSACGRAQRVEPKPEAA